MTNSSVTIPHSYFLAEAKKEYSGSLSRRLLIEFLQNSLDAGASKIHIALNGRKLTVEDNGHGMNKRTIQDGLLTFGGSVKGEAAVGGFGKAKFLLLFAQSAFQVQSNDIVVKGSGLYYDITEHNPYLQGSRFDIEIPGEWPESLEEMKAELTFICERSNVAAQIWFNGELIPQAKPHTTSIEEDTAIIREHDLKAGGTCVRFNGLYMFSQDTGHNYFYDVKAHGRDVLMQNREGFRWECPERQAFSAFINTLTQNSMSGLKAQTTFKQAETTEKMVGGIKCRGENPPDKLNKRERQLFALTVVVCRHLGYKLNKKNFGFCYFDGFNGLGRTGQLWLNPNKFKGEDWIYDAIETIIHELTHARGYEAHNESFINVFGDMMKQFMKKKLSERVLLAETKPLEDCFTEF